MKSILTISILLNVMLLGAVTLLWVHPWTISIPAPAIPAAAVKVEPEASPVVQTVAVPFRWSQLVDTNDYRIFVANLRAAGCPESTVEDIVQGDAERAFSMMRERLGVSPTEPGHWSAQAQVQMAAYLLGEAPTAEVAADTTPTPTRGRSQRPYHPAIVPLALRNLDLTQLGLSPDQIQSVEQARQDFLQQTGGTQPDPSGTNYPAFLGHWEQAQTMADSRLRTTLGNAYWKLMEMAAAQQAAAQMTSQN